ncbi:MAG: hypothetical protein HYS07_07965 [Chlamydiae bacterium]|nr:hypothetical protein [Chlamydiota bacterium]MBI3278072.1 hypothetical protein [Chlamydiota bacterium]
MKKLAVLVALVLGLICFNPGQSQADHGDDWGWFAAGAATGLITGVVLADSSYHSHYGYYSDPYYHECYHPSYYYHSYHPYARPVVYHRDYYESPYGYYTD